jgi:tetratricopeptide (TPR) repeat protein
MGELDGAAAAFATARELWETSTSCDLGLLDPSRIFDLEASLDRDRRRFPEAIELLGRALAAAPNSRRTGSILLNKAFTHEQAADIEAATEALAQAAPLLDRRGDHREAFGLRFNLAVNLCHLGRHAEAVPLAAEARELAVALENEIDLLRVLWLEARIAAGLGRREEAVAKLRQVRREFAAREIAYDAALATLDLAVILLEAHDNAEVRALAAKMVAVFESLEVRREALAAVRLFWQAAEQETATAELGRRLLRFLERARHDPELRFDGVETWKRDASYCEPQ